MDTLSRHSTGFEPFPNVRLFYIATACQLGLVVAADFKDSKQSSTALKSAPGARTTRITVIYSHGTDLNMSN
jgi:hypothetical protein